MPPLFIFTHGVGGRPDSCFIPAVRAALEARGARTHAPAYPDASDPDFPAWKRTFDGDLARLWDGEADLFLVGHSLGGYFTLRLIGESASAPWAARLRGVVLVAPSSLRRPERRRFYSEEVDWAAIRRLQFRLTLLYSDDDDKVARQHQDLVIEKLGDRDGFAFLEPRGWQHFITEDAPPVTDAVLALLQPAAASP
jgi:predicted alpha/beta hydrolase family esterase